jgi:hypothetical protein
VLAGRTDGISAKVNHPVRACTERSHRIRIVILQIFGSAQDVWAVAGTGDSCNLPDVCYGRAGADIRLVTDCRVTMRVSQAVS